MAKPVSQAQREKFASLLAQGVSQIDAHRQTFPGEKLSDATRAVHAHNVARHPKTLSILNELLAPAMERAALKVDAIQAELAAIALCDPGAAFDKQGRLLSLPDMPAQMRAAVAAFDVEETATDEGVSVRIKKIRLWNKVEALDKAMRYRGMFDLHNRQLTDPIARLLERMGRSAIPVVADDPEAKGGND